jgi:Ser/Thr protein kinase RdoA (MazF antagonist)
MTNGNQALNDNDDSPINQDFAKLTPDIFLGAVEDALDIRLTGLAHPLTSYINRVFELQAVDGTRLIAKFYRPGRWSVEAIHQEHDFVIECENEEVPVAAPLDFTDDTTLGFAEGIPFAVYDKRLGRELEPLEDEDWRRLGRVVARMHLVGSKEDAPDRVVMHPAHSTAADLEQLRSGDFIGHRYQREFGELADDILATITPRFDDAESIRIHGDCHQGNLLERPGEGILAIDFDDMAMGPPVQDLWMLLPGYSHQARYQINLVLQGYEDFREFDDRSLKLIESLRIMRILYFLAWCSRQISDSNFQRNFPDWGSDAFWCQEIGDLRNQLAVIKDGGQSQ